jgi:two-component system, NtrC family, nitrogen regulation response regulator GlnG|tara:strand:- start:2047 stop:3435 length:1389 start_codon:yes stop_codon:yes gene_type:complete
MKKIWVLDDDKSIRWVFEKALSGANLPFQSFSNTNEAINQFNHEIPSVIVSDIRMPGESGIEFLTKVKEKFPQIPIIIMTAYSDLDTAVSAFQKGAFEYIAKPFDIDKVLEIINQALEQSTKTDNKSNQPDTKLPEIIGQAQSMQEVFRAIGRLSKSNATVLLNGESGSGKELVANAIHKNSSRKDSPFIAINTAAIPKDLLEAELFGHEKGSFTGAQNLRKGRFEQSNNGTLFLDEIGDMPMELQTRLLRVLSDGKFYRIGGQDSIEVDVRVIAATHQDLEECVKNGEFREDLFHRLNVIRITVPPLRKRVDDIPTLSNYFLQKSASQLKVTPKFLSKEVLEYFSQLHWRGNVRQLENVCHWLTVMSPGNQIIVSDLPSELKEEPVNLSSGSGAWQENLARDFSRNLLDGKLDLHKFFLEQVEKIIIEKTLEHTKNRKLDAADILGIGRNTVTRKIKAYKI